MYLGAQCCSRTPATKPNTPNNGDTNVFTNSGNLISNSAHNSNSISKSVTTRLGIAGVRILERGTAFTWEEGQW